VLLFLTLTLALLLWGAREGLLNKFVDVSVGYIEGAGIPIWLAANYGLSGINRDLLQNQALSQQNITLYPYREVEYHEVDLPKQGDNGPKIWGRSCTSEPCSPSQNEDHTLENGDTTSITEEKVSFNGWAVSFQDPLWQMGMKTPPDSTLPLDIILNRSLFEQYFNCSAYVKALPMPISTDDSDKLGCLANGVLWLDVKVGRNRELLPFRIHWQPHIPTMQNLAFLFPLSTLNTLKMVKRHDAVTYYPEQADDCANSNNRVKELIIWGASDELMTKLGACLQNPERKRTRLTLKQPLPKSWVAECAEQNGIPIKGKEDRRSPPFIQITEKLPQPYCFQYDAEDYLTISCQENCQPCQAISTLRDRIGERVECSDDGAKIDMIAATGSYQKAFAYVENRLALSIQVDRLKNFRTKQGKQAFYLPSTYEDALVRFRFIDQIIGILQWASSPFFLIFLIILLLVQVGIVINHRKHNYGIFLSKGVSRWQVRAIVMMQITLSFAVAMVFAVLIDESMQWLLAGELESVAAMKPYTDHIIIGQLDLLPLSVLDYFWVGVAVLFVLYLITWISLQLMILKQDREPAYLFD
jgi:hypothetical protein